MSDLDLHIEEEMAARASAARATASALTSERVAELRKRAADYVLTADECQGLLDALDASRAEAERLDAQFCAVRVALTAAGVPHVEPYPDEPVSDWERSLRAGGRVVPCDEGVRRLAGERDEVRAALASTQDELRAANAAGQFACGSWKQCREELKETRAALALAVRQAEVAEARLEHERAKTQLDAALRPPMVIDHRAATMRVCAAVAKLRALGVEAGR